VVPDKVELSFGQRIGKDIFSFLPPTVLSFSKMAASTAPALKLFTGFPILFTSFL
jgi:hypothetical protein